MHISFVFLYRSSYLKTAPKGTLCFLLNSFFFLFFYLSNWKLFNYSFHEMEMLLSVSEVTVGSSFLEKTSEFQWWWLINSFCASKCLSTSPGTEDNAYLICQSFLLTSIRSDFLFKAPPLVDHVWLPRQGVTPVMHISNLENCHNHKHLLVSQCLTECQN